MTACARYGFWSGGHGVSVWREDMHLADLSAGTPYTWGFILDQCGGDHAAAREAVCGLAVLAACGGWAQDCRLERRGPMRPPWPGFAAP